MPGITPPPPPRPPSRYDDAGNANTVGRLLETLTKLDPSTRIVILVYWKGRKKIGHVDTATMTVGADMSTDELVKIDPTIVFSVEVRGTMN
jgi:hypothetical protein